MTAAATTSATGAVRGNLVIGAISVAVGAAVIPYGASMPYIREGIPGPGLFPMMIGGLLILFGVLLALTSLLAARRESSHRAELDALGAGAAASSAATTASRGGALPGGEDVEDPVVSTAAVMDTDVGSDGPRRWINGVVLMGGIVFYVLFAEIIGFPLTMALLVTAIVGSLRAKWWVAVATGVITSLALWAMFEQGLMVQLPDGIIPGF